MVQIDSGAVGKKFANEMVKQQIWILGINIVGVL